MRFTVGKVKFELEPSHHNYELTSRELLEHIQEENCDRDIFDGYSLLHTLIDPAKVAKAFKREAVEHYLDGLRRRAIELEWQRWAREHADELQAIRQQIADQEAIDIELYAECD